MTGSPQYIDCGPGVSFATISDGGTAAGMSAAFWVNRTAGGDQKIFSDTDNTSWAAAGGFKAAIYNNRLEPDIRDSKGRFWSRDTTQTAMEQNRWYHIVMVLDDAQDTYTEYLDGVVLRQLTGITQGIAASTVNFFIGRDTPRNTGYVAGMLDDVRIYNHALSEEEVQDVMAGRGPALGAAVNPSPENQAEDVYTDVTLAWKPGQGAVAHDIYLGIVAEDVNNAGRANALGLLLSQGQEANTFELEGLEVATTYYWRVDEIEGDGVTIHKGNVWSFTTEPVALPVENIAVTASSAEQGKAAENTINGSGLDANDLHSSDNTTMWLSASGAASPAWIQYNFDRVYKLQQMLVWNYNGAYENILGYGCKDVTVEYSTDGTDWTVLGDYELARATGADGLAASTIDFNGAGVKAVKLTINSGWATRGQYGLSEVRFLYIPVQARDPQPASGAEDVGLDVVLDWKAGREAVTHEVYLGNDEQAVADGTALVDAVDVSSYTPSAIELGTTYFWKINEVNEAEVVASWEGDVWNFSTIEYIPIDDMESYTDDMGSRIYETWLDGYEIDDNGSQVGNDNPPYAERTIVNSGQQSMPMTYDNAQASYSEATRTWDTPQNWAVGGADMLVLSVRGNPTGVTEGEPGSLTVSGIGADIFGTADQFRFVYKQLSGDGSIVARVDSLADTNPFALAGVMIRQSLDADSAFAGVFLTGENGVRARTRVSTGAGATSDTSVATAEQLALSAPVWIKFERVGNDFTAYYATDEAGANWTAMSWGPQAVGMVGPVYVGLAVCSHNAAAPTTAQFAAVSTSNGVSGQWAAADIGVVQPDNKPDQLYVTLKDSAGHASTVLAAPDAVLQGTWQEWRIPASSFASVSLDRVKTMIIGVGDRANPQHGSGQIFIDDIKIGKPVATE